MGYDVNGSFVVMPGDVAALQKQVKADLEAIRSSLQRCATAGTFAPDKTPTEWTSWQSMKQRAEDFLAESPSFLSSGSQYDRGEAIQKELASWHDRAKALGCDAGPAPLAPAGGGLDLSNLFGGLSTTALLVLVAILAFRHK